jgi:hypothetical protein
MTKSYLLHRLSPALLLLLAASCGGPTRLSVEGTVTYQNRPLADVEVQFVPDPAAGTRGSPASAYTDAQGHYRIEALGREGVVRGTHRVVINDARAMMPMGPGVDADSGEAQPGAPVPGVKAGRRGRFPPVYSDLNRTPLKGIAVTTPGQTLDFELQPNP